MGRGGHRLGRHRRDRRRLRPAAVDRACPGVLVRHVRLFQEAGVGGRGWIRSPSRPASCSCPRCLALVVLDMRGRLGLRRTTAPATRCCSPGRASSPPFRCCCSRPARGDYRSVADRPAAVPGAGTAVRGRRRHPARAAAARPVRRVRAGVDRADRSDRRRHPRRARFGGGPRRRPRQLSGAFRVEWRVKARHSTGTAPLNAACSCGHVSRSRHRRPRRADRRSRCRRTSRGCVRPRSH